MKIDILNTNGMKMQNQKLTAAAGVTCTVNGANQYYTPKATSTAGEAMTAPYADIQYYPPKATSTAGTGETGNVDNRYQNLTITVTSGTVKVGDRFTLAGVNAVHHITKGDTGALKTFLITAIVSGGGGSGVVQISPPIISATGGTDAELAYKNVTAAPANGADLTSTKF